MAEKSQQQSQSGSQKQQGGNFGQDEAKRQQQAEQNLDRMGDKSGTSDQKNKQQG